MDALIAILAMMILIAPFLWLHVPYWPWFLLTLALFVGVWELLLRLLTGRTLSQWFWRWRGQHRGLSWLLLGLLGAAWVGLLVHLAWR